MDLFDGKTLKGWVNVGGANFRVENGVITVDKGPSTWLRSKETYKDYELRLEFKTTADGNSGVFCAAPQSVNRMRPATSCKFSMSARTSAPARS